MDNNNINNNDDDDLLQSIQQSEVLHLLYLHYKSTLKKKNIHIIFKKRTKNLQLSLLLKIPYIKDVSTLRLKELYSVMFLIATGSLLKVVAAEC